MYGKIGDGGLTGGANRAIVMAKGLVNPRNSGRCLRHGGDLRIFVSIPGLYFAGLREPACESTSGTTTDVFLTPYQARSFCVLRKHSESGNSNDQISRRSTCTAISSRQPCNSSRTGSSPRSTRPRRNAGRASANSGAIRILPVRPRRRSKSNISEPQSATRFSLSASCGGNSARFTQKTRYARIQEGGRSEHEKNHMAGRRLVSDRRGGIRRRFPDDGPMSGK